MVRDVVPLGAREIYATKLLLDSFITCMAIVSGVKCTLPTFLVSESGLHSTLPVQGGSHLETIEDNDVISLKGFFT